MELSNLLKKIQRHYAIILGNDDRTIRHLAARITESTKKKNIKVDVHTVLIPNMKDLKEGCDVLFSLGPLKYTTKELPIIIIDNQLFSLGILPTEGDFLKFFTEGITPAESNSIKNVLEKELTLEQVLSLVNGERGLVIPDEATQLPQEKIDELIIALKSNLSNSKIIKSEQSELNDKSEIKIVDKSNDKVLKIKKQFEKETKIEELSCVTCSHYLPRTEICHKLLKRVKLQDISFYDCKYHENS